MRGSCLGKGPVLVTAEGEWQWVRQVGRGEEEEGGGIAPPPPTEDSFSRGAERGRVFPLCEPKLCQQWQGPPIAALEL